MKANRQYMLLAGVSALVLASTAHAQTGAKATSVDEVVVTGSRVITNGNDSPTPLTIVSTDDLKTVHPTNLAEALADLPVFSANFRSQTQNSGAGGPQNAPAGAQSGANVLNLRSLGPLRTLILYDGHRAAPNTPDGYVDADTIPQALLKRVDVVTGGASAVYGSDAISGVVNFITDTSFEGIKGSLQTGISDYGDGKTVDGSLAFGRSLFGGRGHVLASYSNRRDDSIDIGTARPFREEQRFLGGIGTAANPLILYTNGRNMNSTYGGKVNCATGTTFLNGKITCPTNPLADLQFTSGGFLVPFVHGAPSLVAANNVEIGGDGTPSDSAQIRAGLEMNQFYGRFDFDFTDNVHGYVMVADALNKSVSTGGYFSQNRTFSRDNAFLLPQYRNQLIAANMTTFNVSRSFTDIARGRIEADSDQVVFSAGLNGRFGDGYKWDVAYTKGKSRFDVLNRGAVDQGRLFAALDVVPSGGWVNGLPVGAPVCRAAQTNPTYAGCVPLNAFGANAVSYKSFEDYIFHTVEYNTKIGSDDVTATLTGSPFSDWAGPVNIALSGEWRNLSYQIDTNSLPSVFADCSGIAANCTATTVKYSASALPVPKVSRAVKEAAIEADIPLLKDQQFAKTVDLSLAYRLAQYEVTGAARTWKVGLTWDVNDQITVRGTRSHDFRAPALDELFRAQTVTNNGGFADLMPGTLAQNPPQNVRVEAGGNPGLKPEVSDTLTYGIVFRPNSSFSISVDAFDIKVKNAIFQTQGNDSVVQTVCYASKGTSSYCSLIGRALGNYTDTSAANPVVLWRQVFVNAANHDTQGVDLEASFRTSIADRPLNLRLLTTYQPHIFFGRDGVPTLDFAGVYGGSGGFVASPKVRMTAFADFKVTSSFAVSVQERWRSSLKYTPEANLIVASPDIKSVAYTNVNLTYTPDVSFGKVDFFLNVANLFNTDPPKAAFYLNPNPAGGDVAAGDDVIGRYFTLGVRFRH